MQCIITKAPLTVILSKVKNLKTLHKKLRFLVYTRNDSAGNDSVIIYCILPLSVSL